MGDHAVDGQPPKDARRRAFMRALLEDVRALERMLGEGRFETGVRRIGAEQEMFLVDRAMQPAPVATDLLARTDDPRLTTELARFNLEANLSPHPFGGRCLRALEDELEEVLAKARQAAAEVDAEVVLTGTLPTLRRAHASLDWMTPDPRYHALNQAMKEARGGEFRLDIAGLDELELTHDNVMYEACNTSFQIHFQVAPEEFARLYNVAQAVTAPVLAAAVNSPLFLGRRLWRETRVALFQSSVDSRHHRRVHERAHRPRVSFGDGWVKSSVLEIFREDIARFRILLAREVDEDPAAVLARGDVPQLSALRLHNGTVYRWNRPCYGVADGVAHLRIENRVLPAGPSVIDQVANAAFYFGLMSGVLEELGDVAAVLDFDHAKANFFAAARHGLDAQFTWVGGQTMAAAELILTHLLPLARAGLAARGIDAGDVDRYLGVLEERVRANQTGASWMLRSLRQMGEQGTRDLRERRLVQALLDRQREGEPVHRWPLADLPSGEAWAEAYRTVGQFMSTDLFTVQPDDLVDLAASVMEWEHIRHVPVEDDSGRLVGIITHRSLLRLVADRLRQDELDGPVPVSRVMRRDPITARPDTPTLEAVRLMRTHGLGCLPVVDEGGQLVGILTERDLIEVSAPLLERFLGAPPGPPATP
jgi:CBS domain-containing protein/gamma-glutamyl:cysteine ligase YbdK (ATP-grasp superfamily)